MSEDAEYLAAEARARILIDKQLTEAGWSVQDRKNLNLIGHVGVAVRETWMARGHGRTDYLLYVEKKVVGVIESKPEGTTLAGVEWQSAMYATGLPANIKLAALDVDGRLPFVFEASGTETYFTNGYDPEPRARKLFWFPKPSALAEILRAVEDDPTAATWRAKVQHMPELDVTALRPAQIAAIDGIEQSLANQQFSRSLVQMATGAGKTFTAVTSTYRLLKHAGFQRVLFLVDRNNLADQTLAEFQNYQTPDDGRRFTEIYNVDKLKSGGPKDSSDVVISTIQRVFSVLNNKDVPEDDDPELDGWEPKDPVPVSYNAKMPPEAFDLIIVDEAHRSIYGIWQNVLRYFDAHIVGLTATPGKQTFGFFKQNLVSEYTYPESVADGVNVDFDLYKISTEITANGSTIDAGTVVPTIDKRTREEKLVALDDDLQYTGSQLDRAVVSENQIRLVLQTFKDRLFTDIFPGRSTVPKTLIFCKDDNHAETVTRLVREVFGKGNEFAAKITHKGTDPKGHLQHFRTSATLRVAVTVDMIATGTDVKPLECVFFMRDVRSAQYFEQMKGRGARTIASADFQAVTPDAKNKTRFVIVDAIGVTDHPFVDPPLNRDKNISLKQLLDKAAQLNLDEAETATLASRLAALELQLTPEERTELDGVAGQAFTNVIHNLVDAVDPSKQAEALKDEEDPEKALQELLSKAIEPLAGNPELRHRIIELRRSHDRIIDEVSVDTLLDAYGVVDTTRAQAIVDSWAQYLEDNRDEITAIQLMFEAKDHRVPFEDIKELADRISRPPHSWTPDLLWAAYEAVESGKVKKTDKHTLTDLVSLLRFTLGSDVELVSYADRVHERYAAWLVQQEQAGTTYTESERWWLDRMAEVVATSAGVSPSDLEAAPFIERGGVDGISKDLGSKAVALIDELNKELTA